MAKYTLELGTINRRCGSKVFDFPYPFYDESHKKDFEDKFVNHYFFDEIGFETVGRFRHRLQTRLTEIMPYYQQLYKTELEARDIKFLLNKDLKETFIREVAKTDTSTGSNTDNTSGNENTDYRESNLANGNAYLSNDSLTAMTNNHLKVNNTSNSTSNSTSNGNENESTTLISQGNIGTTSSAELLQKWRDVLINIDLMIIEECKDLFMSIF